VLVPRGGDSYIWEDRWRIRCRGHCLGIADNVLVIVFSSQFSLPVGHGCGHVYDSFLCAHRAAEGLQGWRGGKEPLR
jgi:hypothetical protein